jgi:hypothetical protein
MQEAEMEFPPARLSSSRYPGDLRSRAEGDSEQQRLSLSRGRIVAFPADSAPANAARRQFIVGPRTTYYLLLEFDVIY